MLSWRPGRPPQVDEMEVMNIGNARKRSGLSKVQVHSLLPQIDKLSAALCGRASPKPKGLCSSEALFCATPIQERALHEQGCTAYMTK